MTAWKWNLSVETQPLEVTSTADRADPNWTATDSHGHVHTARMDTVVARWGEPYWEGGDEVEDFLGWACRECGDPVEPGTLSTSMWRQYVGGLTTATLTLEADDGTVETWELSRATSEAIAARRPGAGEAVRALLTDADTLVSHTLTVRP